MGLLGALDRSRWTVLLSDGPEDRDREGPDGCVVVDDHGISEASSRNFFALLGLDVGHRFGLIV